MIRKVVILLLLLSSTPHVEACPVCERNQPELLKGWVHGAGPDSRWDYLIIWLIAGIVLLTLYYSVRWLIQPGEQSADHIKRMILNES